jgi:hypothetical protein
MRKRHNEAQITPALVDRDGGIIMARLLLNLLGEAVYHQLSLV